MDKYNIYFKTVAITLIILVIYPFLGAILFPGANTAVAEGVDRRKAYAGLALTAILAYLITEFRDGELNIDHTTTRDSGDYKDEDLNWLARAVTGESRGEPYLGQVAVAAVILNRVEHDEFPDTIYDVIYQPGQFAAVDDGQINLSPTESSYKASRDALSGNDPSQGAIFFYNPDTARTLWWLETRSKTVRIGDHVFAK